MTCPTVGLVMIVKNESVALPRLAESLKGHIDHWTIVDTGSTDNTIEVARSVFGEIPGEVIEDSWRGFGPSWNVAVEAADAHTDWLLHLDADHRFHGEIDAELLSTDADAINLEERYGILRYWLPRLTLNGTWMALPRQDPRVPCDAWRCLRQSCQQRLGLDRTSRRRRQQE